MLTKKEIKDLGVLLLIVLPMFICLYVYWMNSTMYNSIYQAQRLEAASYILRSYHGENTTYDVQKMLDHYNLIYLSPGAILVPDCHIEWEEQPDE